MRRIGITAVMMMRMWMGVSIQCVMAHEDMTMVIWVYCRVSLYARE